ncbi:HEAT repeat domain-containing protein [Viridibacillus arvi]|uniref:HEAT repeat domain-containing protein n=1 Tax=Viridibacillus arvi TaxID=263475 RepID=UPI003CFD680E
MVERELLKLIEKMADRGSYTSSEDSPSWNAYRKAREITDISVIPFLNNLLEKSKDREIRDGIYFILGKIGENTGDERVVEILLKWLEKETDKYTLSSVLGRISEQKIVKECSAILKFIKDERWLVRQDAIRALRGCKSSIAEEALIKIISETTDEYDLTYANSVLFEIGTYKAIPHLLNLLDHTKGDVKCSALSALNEIGDASLLPTFLDALQDRSGAVKGYAMLGINRHGNETAIKPVIERIKNMLKRKRNVVSDDIVLALGFLIRFEEGNEEIHKLFDWIKTKKWDFLFESEKKWITANITKF